MDAVVAHERKKTQIRCIQIGFHVGFNWKTAIFRWLFFIDKLKQRSYFNTFNATCITNGNWWKNKHNITCRSFDCMKPTCPNSVTRVQLNFLNLIEKSLQFTRLFFYSSVVSILLSLSFLWIDMQKKTSFENFIYG